MINKLKITIFIFLNNFFFIRITIKNIKQTEYVFNLCFFESKYK